jgi:CHAT domain-containing protein/Tfp pilus assembly protein PilF
MKSPTRRAGALMALGDKAAKRGDHARARRYFEEALALRRQAFGATHPRVADSLNKLGAAFDELADYEAALHSHQEALTIARNAFGDQHVTVAHSLSGLGWVARHRADYLAARGYFEQALAIRRKALGEEHPDVANSLNALGIAANDLSDYTGAQHYHDQALAIRRRLPGEEHLDVAASLTNRGRVSLDQGDFPAARGYLEEALAIRRRALGEEHLNVAHSLNNLGLVLEELADYAAARDYYEQALAIKRRAFGKEHPDVAASLNNLGTVSKAMGNYAGARGYHEQALAIRRAVLGEEHPDVAASLNNLGVACSAVGDYAAAIDYYERSLAIWRGVIDEEHPHFVAALNNLGTVSKEIGDYAAARRYHERALVIRRRVLGKHHPDVASSLNNLGVVASDLGDYAAARRYHERALAILRRVLGKHHPEVASSLNNLGNVYEDLGDYAAARRYHQRALAILRRAFGEGHPDLAGRLTNLARIYRKEGDLERSGALLEEALGIGLLPDQGVVLPETYQGLSALNGARGAAAAAIFFGKQAVNMIQRQRGRLTALEPDLQRSFLATKEKVYHGLADRLVAAGRLGEAQQVLAMLKEEELFDLLRRDAANDPRMTFAQLTSLEAQWQSHGDALGRDLVRLTEEIAALRKRDQRSPEEEVRLRAARAALDATGRAFRGWLDGLRRELDASADRDAHSAAINLDLLERLQGELRALGPGVALVSYILGDDRLSIILTTASLQVSREAAVAQHTVNQLVHEFRLAIDKRLDSALPLGQILWRHLIAPIAEMLDEFGITTLMVVPYGTLRYVPLAALHDGEHYLVERFALAILTLAAHGNIKDPPVSDWHVAALGVSREVPGYRRLLAVAEELSGIVQTVPDGAGVYPGVICLDEAFTEDSLAAALDAHQAVHVASHFVLNPAQGLQSHLLLGDGSSLTIDRLRDASFDFHGVELMTLSACETAIGSGQENGREFEGFGALVQWRGAKAVIASLWPVADRSTAPLMTAFYRARRQGFSKAAALRAAQLASLANADSDRDYAHPYHWAPFVLMGNWL